MFANRWTLWCLKATQRSPKHRLLSRWIHLSGLLGAFAAVALAGPSAEAGGWFEKTTGFRTPEPIRKIAPKGIQFSKLPRHNPPSHVTPNSVFNQPPKATNNWPKPGIKVQPANNFGTKTVSPAWPKTSNYWVEQQRADQERLKLQQQQVQLQQQQLRFQQDAMKAQQKAQVIGTIFQGIGSLIPQERPRYSNLPYDYGNGFPSLKPLNQVDDAELQESDFSQGNDELSLSEALFGPTNP